MTKRSPISVQRPIWYDAQQVDETDLNTEQQANQTIEASIINNHVGSGVLADNLIDNILFDSLLATGIIDGKPITPQNQPSDNNFGNQVSISLTNSAVSGRKTIKICLIGLDFQNNLQYEIFYFKTNEIQTGKKHFTKILTVLFNDFVGNSALSFNLGGHILITEANPLTLSRDVVMIAQDQQPNLFFRDFFIDPSLGAITLQTMLQNALPFYNISTLNIFTQQLDNIPLFANDVTTQIGQKFQATTNNIQKVSLLLAVQNTATPSDLAWNGDIIVSVYPLQSEIDCPSDIAPELAIQFSPSNIPLAQISYNYSSLQADGIILSSVAQPVDFVFSNSPIANGNVMSANNYYAVTIKRSGAANKCDILIATGSDLIPNSQITTFAGTLWVDLPDQDLWFKIYTDAAKVSDGQAYDQGNGSLIPKTIIDPTTQTTIDNSFGAQQFTGNDVFKAVFASVIQDSDEVPDQRTGNPVDSRQQYVPHINLLNSIDIANLQQASDPTLIGSISDKNIKFFDGSQSIINSKLYSATMAEDELLIRIVDDPTDTTRFDSSVSGLITNLLNGDLIGAKIFPDSTNNSIFYRIADAKLCSMIVGDVDGNGIVDENDLALLNTYLGYNLNLGLAPTTSITTDGYHTTFSNGYDTLIQPFANLFNINFQLVDPNTNIVVAAGTDGVLVANPNDPRSANFTSASVNFNLIVGLSSYHLVILNSSVNGANWGGWQITSLNATLDVITIYKVLLTGDNIAQMLRADIDGDFVITYADGYLLENYIEKLPSSTVPPSTFPAPSSNPYTKIGTRFNVIRMRLEEFVDRNDDYAASPNNRALSVHPPQDIFLGDGYFTSHNFYLNPSPITINKQLIWDESLVITNSQSKLVPTIFTYPTGNEGNSCSIQGIQCNVYPVPTEFDAGRTDFFVPNNLVIGTGELQRPNGDYYKVDFEVGTVVLEVPDGLFGTEKTIDIMNDFIVDYTGNGATRKGYPSMRFADCSFVDGAALTNDQLRFSVAVQSFSPNTNGLTTDGYSGIIVDGKMGVNIDYETGLLTLNFTNLYQDPTLLTLSTKIQVNVFLKKSGFNNQTLFVDATKVQNMLSLISVFSGANDGGPSTLVDLQNDVTGILPLLNGGTGLNAVGLSGTVLTSNGSGVSYQFISSANVEYTAASSVNWNGSPPTNVKDALDRIAAKIGPIS